MAHIIIDGIIPIDEHRFPLVCGAVDGSLDTHPIGYNRSITDDGKLVLTVKAADSSYMAAAVPTNVTFGGTNVTQTSGSTVPITSG